MNKFLSIVFLIAALASACTSPSPSAERKTIAPSMRIPTETHGDTLQINSKLLLFMWPDSLQAEQMKLKDSDAFYTAADDYSFYNSQLMDIADSLGIKNVSTSAKYLSFPLFDNTYYIVNRAADEKFWWGLFLYNGKDTPQLQSTVDIDSKFLHNFFK